MLRKKTTFTYDNDHIDDNSQRCGMHRNNHNNKHLHREFPLLIESRNLVCLEFIKARIVIRMIIFPMKLGNSLKRVDVFSGGHGPTFCLVPCRNG